MGDRLGTRSAYGPVPRIGTLVPLGAFWSTSAPAASIRRPASVIRIQGARSQPVRARSVVGVANPTRTRLFSISTENPHASSATSALPLSPAAANASSARRHLGLSGILFIAKLPGPALWCGLGIIAGRLSSKTLVLQLSSNARALLDRQAVSLHFSTASVTERWSKGEPAPSSTARPR
jgi:hypothetical protein